MKIQLLLLITLFFSTYAPANVVINGTRFVYLEGVDSIPIQLTNDSNNAALVQAWVDNGNFDSTPENSDANFYLSPPVVRIESKQGQQLKLKKLEQKLPNNIESVFYLNVLDIPKTPDYAKGKNYIQLATRSRIKIFYRPKGLIIPPDEAYENIIYQLNNNHIQVKNNSPYNFTIASISSENDLNKSLIEAEMIPPLSTKELPLKETPTSHNLVIKYVDDYGAYKSKNVKL
ncbi:putative fimbrial chaperone YehC [Providencia manganoxydans]|uniref:fimbrial biogenesis chaperone n=1 Tax=Providencia TaxID=586 RepID=UPI00111F5FCF|nr:molecular chaperone [Providencia stuartii]